jgi:hypothetical protein
LSAGALRLPAPAGKRLALAFTLGLHLLAALFWLQERRVRPAGPPQVVSILLRPDAPARPAPASPPLLPQVRPRVPPRAAAPTAGLPAPIAVAPEPVPAAPPPAEPAADPLADPAPATTTGAPVDLRPGGSFGLDMAKRQAGRVDRALRQGKSGVPLEADTPWARFRRGLEAAHVEPGMGVQLDSYTAPDGVVIYRERVGKRTFCRRTGSVGLGVAGTAGINDAGNVPCPSGVQWRREP